MKPKGILICDANILIDYLDVNMSILCLATTHCYEIYVPETVLAEVRQIKGVDLNALGIKRYELKFNHLVTAKKMSNSSSLSEEDSLCFIIAKEEGWICATNEKALRNKCQREKVDTIRGLRFMLDLVEHGRLSTEDAISTAKKIGDMNPRMPQNVIDKFIRLIEDTIPRTQKQKEQ